MAPRFAFVGLGLMGQAMSKNLVDSGKLDSPLLLYNRTRSTTEQHCASIGYSRVAATLEDAVAGSDIIWSCLLDDQAVGESFDRIIALDVKGKLFIDSSSITPEQTNRIAKQLLEAGAEFVSMPVMGEPSMASRKMLTCIAAGAASSVDRIKPYFLGIIGQSVVDLSGEEPGTASLLKLMGNVLIMTTMEQVAEVNVFAEKTGLGTGNMEKLLTAMFPRPPHAIYNQKMLSGDYYQGKPMADVKKAQNLSAHVLNLAKNCGAALPSYEVAVKHLEVAETHGGPTADITGIYGAVRVESGLPYKNGSE